MAGKLWDGVKAGGRALERYLGDEPTGGERERKPEPTPRKTTPGDPARRRPSPRPRREPEVDPLMQEPDPDPEPGPERARRPVPPQPVAPPVPLAVATHTGGAMTQTPMLQMQEMADQMVAIATRWEPEGMLEVLDAYRHWPDVLHRAAEAWKIMHRKAQEQYPLKPVVVELIEAVHRHQELTASSAEEIAPTAHALHRDQIEALQDKRNAMWDHRANRDQAAA